MGNDNQVTWNEFEMDAFTEEHYNLGAKCQTSKTPLNKHEVTVVENLIKKFHGNTKTKEMSHSMWYQITSLLTEKAIDAINGPAKGPPLGCMHKQPGDTNNKPKGSGHGKFDCFDELLHLWCSHVCLAFSLSLYAFPQGMLWCCRYFITLF